MLSSIKAMFFWSGRSRSTSSLNLEDRRLDDGPVLGEASCLGYDGEAPCEHFRAPGVVGRIKGQNVGSSRDSDSLAPANG